MFYQTHTTNEETGEETTEETWAHVKDLQYIQIESPTNFEILALMDYDEEIIFTLDYSYEPVEFEEKIAKAFDKDAKLAVYIAIGFFVFVLFFLVCYCCCCGSNDTKNAANLEDALPPEIIGETDEEMNKPRTSEQDEDESND